MSIAVAVLPGCKDDVLQPDKPNEEVIPSTNADGNYNIIFITADQEHFMENYPVGSDYKARTRLRQLGTTFQRHYSCSNVSTPSRSAIYTGTHITQTRMLDNTNYPFQLDMDENITTIGDRMRNLGYYTAYKGKWHLSKPSEAGGDQSGALEKYGFANWQAGGDAQGGLLEGYGEDLHIATEACDWIKDKGTPLNNEGKSFFLAVNFVNPHDVMYFDSDENPDHPRNSIMEISGAPADPVYAPTYPMSPIPASWNQPMDSVGRVQAHIEYYKCWNKMVGKVPSKAENWERFRDYYYNCIQDSDNQLNELLKLLEEKKMLANTIIVMTADHGEMLGAHGLKGKGGFMYEDNIHVPLIIYHPEQKGGNRCNSITSHLDLAPTMIDLTNAKNKQAQLAELKGYSLFPLVKDTHKSVRNEEGALFVFDMISMIDGDFVIDPFDHRYKIDGENRGFVRGIITSQYKFARYFSPVAFNTPTDLEALYRDNDVEMFRMSLHEIPDEMENLAAGKAENASLINAYNQKLNSLISREIGTDNGSETDAYHPGGIRNFLKQR